MILRTSQKEARGLFRWLLWVAAISLLDLAGIPRRLSDCGVERKMIAAMSEDAARQWTAGFNPRPVSAQDFAHLYEAAF